MEPPDTDYRVDVTIKKGVPWLLGEAGTKSLEDSRWVENRQYFWRHGREYEDTLCFADHTCFTHTHIYMTLGMSALSADMKNDGILGLSRNSTFLKRIKDWVKYPAFTADLRRISGGVYDFGKIDDSKYTGNITYTRVLEEDHALTGFWVVRTTGFGFGTDSFTLKPLTAVIDTSTHLILLPADIVQDYWSKVPGSKYMYDHASYVFPCKQNSTLPSLTIGFETHRVTIPGPHLAYAPLGKDGLCEGGLQAAQQPNGPAVIGQLLLKRQFVVFDFGLARVGFADKPL